MMRFQTFQSENAVFKFLLRGANGALVDSFCDDSATKSNPLLHRPPPPLATQLGETSYTFRVPFFLKKDLLSHTLLHTASFFITLGMMLMNNIITEHQELPEEMLT